MGIKNKAADNLRHRRLNQVLMKSHAPLCLYILTCYTVYVCRFSQLSIARRAARPSGVIALNGRQGPRPPFHPPLSSASRS